MCLIYRKEMEYEDIDYDIAEDEETESSDITALTKPKEINAQKPIAKKRNKKRRRNR
jgi:hypothetical protein